MNYTTTSQKEAIRDKKVAKVVDYIERQAGNSFEYIKEGIGFSIIVGGNIHLSFRSEGDNHVEVCPCKKQPNGDICFGDDILDIHVDIFAENVVGIWGSIRTYCKKNG